jgi:hypothetical protein
VISNSNSERVEMDATQLEPYSKCHTDNAINLFILDSQLNLCSVVEQQPAV